ncbi:TPA: hypothetical protein N0F65_008450 [Lagenidium giganteum]|uniref:Uncharacterized protein n=1 Tax=Lagenidium giganteum TaxID=4803 RepID=A0AAV2YRG0_9STRA|nr:TPA: hypothetical protein N0F65_008450 [Lagenidium giganteum]
MGASLAKQCFSGDEPCALFRSQQQLANSAVQHGHEVRRGHSADGQGDGLPPALKLYVDTSGAHMQGIGDAKRVRTGSSGRSSRRRRERTWRSDEDESDRARRHESPMSTTSRSGSSQLSDDSFYDAELGSLSAEEEPVNRLSRVSNGSESAQASPSTDFRRLLPQVCMHSHAMRESISRLRAAAAFLLWVVRC